MLASQNLRRSGIPCIYYLYFHSSWNSSQYNVRYLSDTNSAVYLWVINFRHLSLTKYNSHLYLLKIKCEWNSHGQVTNYISSRKSNDRWLHGSPEPRESLVSSMMHAYYTALHGFIQASRIQPQQWIKLR